MQAAGLLGGVSSKTRGGGVGNAVAAASGLDVGGGTVTKSGVRGSTLASRQQGNVVCKSQWGQVGRERRTRAVLFASGKALLGALMRAPLWQ